MELKYKKYVITVSYGNYVAGEGGTDKFILYQQRMLNSSGISLVHLFPFSFYVKSRKIIMKHIWGMLYDGELVGLLTYDYIIKYLNQLNTEHNLLSCIIHHLKDINIRELDKILDCVKSELFFYIHDFYTICPSGGLTKNNQFFCGSQFPNIDKCESCSMFEGKDIKKLDSIKMFMRKYQESSTVIVPSNACNNIWSAAYHHFKKRVIVIPHQVCSGIYEGNFKTIQETDKINIAFVGYDRDLKGWKEWIGFCNRFENSQDRINLFHLGSSYHEPYGVKQINVDFKTDRNDMINKLRDNKIDVAVLWSKVPETYSYTYFEAYAANCFILTTKDSGNIAAQVELNKNGYIAEDETLDSIIGNVDRLRFLINEFRSRKEYGPNVLLDNTEIIDILRNCDDGSVTKHACGILNGLKGFAFTKMYLFLKR